MKKSDVRRMLKDIRNGNATLRVLGNAENGFRLAGEINKKLFPFGYGFAKQADAVRHGEIQTGQKAKKVVAKKAA